MLNYGVKFLIALLTEIKEQESQCYSSKVLKQWISAEELQPN